MTEDGEREKKSRITAISRATISSGRLPGLHCPGLLFLPPSEPLAPPISPVSPGSPASPASPVFSLALSLHPLPPLERHCERACRKSSPIPPSPHLSPLFIYSFFLLSSIRLPSLISSSFSLLRPPFQHLFPSPLSLSLSLLFLATATSTRRFSVREPKQPIPNERWCPSPSSSSILAPSFFPFSSRPTSRRRERDELKAQARPSSSPATERRERRISCRARFTRRNILHGKAQGNLDDGGDAPSLIRARFHARGWNAGGLK